MGEPTVEGRCVPQSTLQFVFLKETTLPEQTQLNVQSLQMLLLHTNFFLYFIYI